MNRISCDIIQDLLPLYCDDACSDESRRLVEAHLKNCKSCQNMLSCMQKDYKLSCIQEQKDEEIIKDMAISYKKSLKKFFIKGAAVVLSLCLILAAGYFVLFRHPSVLIPTKNIAASIEKESENRIQINIEITDGKKCNLLNTELKNDGTFYITAKRSIIPVKAGGDENILYRLGIAKKGRTDNGETVQIKQIYYGDETDRILIWEEE